MAVSLTFQISCFSLAAITATMVEAKLKTAAVTIVMATTVVTSMRRIVDIAKSTTIASSTITEVNISIIVAPIIG